MPCSPLSLSTYTHLFPTASGKNAAAPLPVDMELADPELAGLEPADPELAVLPAGWLDVDAVVALELFPQPARTSPEAAAAASMAAAGMRVVKPDLFMSCLGLGAGAQKVGAAARPGMASGAGR